ncbi:MAG TPA: TolC family protein [Chitinophagaceae bacterium]|nr:TolC family protein [Chitinophagaceae bacterium]
MFNKFLAFVFLLTLSCSFFSGADAQVLTLKDAVQTALANYGSIKAKTNYISSAKALAKEAQREALPDFTVSAQQDYGTINGINGPVSAFKAGAVASSGPALSSGSWNAAFGALYLANINWDFYSFGKARQKVNVYNSQVTLNESDLAQEKFQQQVRVAAAYLNLLAAQRLTVSQQNNLDRASALRNVVVARVKNGLNAGVDSSLANAEVSNARIALLRARDYEHEQSNQLAILMGVTDTVFVLDTVFISRIPSSVNDTVQAIQPTHPVLQYYQNRIALSNATAGYYHTFNYPTFSAFGIVQGRGSGFDYNYGAANPNAFTHNYWDGINPVRGNYLIGVGVTWNLTNPLRVQQQVLAQKFQSKGLEDEYSLVNEQLANQLNLAAQKMRNALAAYTEAPIQIKAAGDAYLQKNVLYKNGLSNIVDVTQALYALNRAETDRDIAYNNVWEALLLKAAATGDFGIFINEF